MITSIQHSFHRVKCLTSNTRSRPFRKATWISTLNVTLLINQWFLHPDVYLERQYKSPSLMDTSYQRWPLVSMYRKMAEQFHQGCIDDIGIQLIVTNPKSKTNLTVSAVKLLPSSERGYHDDVVVALPPRQLAGPLGPNPCQSSVPQQTTGGEAHSP